MIIDVYAAINGCTNIGEVQILYDRISEIDLKIPVEKCEGGKNLKSRSTVNKRLLSVIRTYKEFNNETLYPFRLKKLSKADPLYRQFGMTHQLLCEEITKAISNPIYLKLSAWQSLKIAYYVKFFFWQTADFRNTIYRSITTSLISLAIGALVTLFLLFIGKKQNQENLQNKLPQKKQQSTDKAKQNNEGENFYDTTNRRTFN